MTKSFKEELKGPVGPNSVWAARAGSSEEVIFEVKEGKL